MKYEFWLSPYFNKQLKPLLKKYRHIKDDILRVFEPFNRNQHQFLGKKIYQIRLKSSDIKRGKSKSFRLIIYISETHKIILPVNIYFKGDREMINLKEINYDLEIVLMDFKKMRNLNQSNDK